MKYLCLACGDESAWEELTEPQQQEIIEKCRVHDEKLAADPRVRLYVGLSEGGRLVRQQEGQQVVTDGPFVESKEIGGVFVVEADDIDEATELAARHPAGQMGEELGWYVVVRPIFVPELEAVGDAGTEAEVAEASSAAAGGAA